MKRIGESSWEAAAQNDMFCPGDAIRTTENSRAAIVLPGGIHVRVEQNSEIIYPEVKNEKTIRLRLMDGMTNFFSQKPRCLKVDTPFVTATVEGSEFLIKVEPDQSLVLVFSGRVNTENEKGSLMLSSGQAALARKGEPPVPYTIVRPRDAVQWALYYPPVIDLRPDDFEGGADWEISIRKSIRFYRKGDLYHALEALENISEEVSDPRFYTYRAGLFLSVGRVDEATGNLDRARALDPSHALPLMSVIALVQNDKAKALELARKAVDGDPESATARVAFAYAQQGNFDLNGALETQQKAVDLERDNGLAWARLAELWLAAGNLSKAEKAAEQAVALNPGFSRAQTVRGYAYLTRIRISDAVGAFEKAIALDQAAPLPRMGLGLAKIRNGDLAEGRGEIEIAASLDPNNSLVRSYLGKAFYEEKRDDLAAKQFDLAKALDPNDPTPWFYDAIHKQANNRPVEALHDLQKSIELNDNRAVYRSKLLLDQDLAARSASLARIYDDLGFQQLALVEGYKSVNTDPGNYSAHRFLADSYSALPRHEIARISEILQAQLLAPVSINPVQPQLAEDKSNILYGTGPSSSSLNEFTPLFARNRLDLQSGGIVGSNDTWGEEIVHYGLWGTYSYSLGQYHYETDGYGINNDLEKDLYNAFFQKSVSPDMNIQMEYRYDERKFGNLELTLAPSEILDTLRIVERYRSIRLGFTHSIDDHSKLILSAIYREDDGNFGFRFTKPPIDFTSAVSRKDKGYLAEIQHMYSSGIVNIISGTGYFDLDNDELTVNTTSVAPEFADIIPAGVATAESSHATRHANIYTYSNIRFPESLLWTLGVSVDKLDSFEADKEQFNPKFGIMWTPNQTTTIRGAVVKTLVRSLISGQTIEPAQVAGFSQFFGDSTGTESLSYGTAIDKKISEKVYCGASAFLRENDKPVRDDAVGSNVHIDHYEWDEDVFRSYVFWTPLNRISLSAEYFYERQKSDYDVPDPDEYLNIKTHSLPLGINFFDPSGLMSRLKATYVHQDYKGIDPENHGGNSITDTFWVFDAELTWRFPWRNGQISLIGKNIFDEKFKFQDTDPDFPRFYPERQVFIKMTLQL